MIKLLSVACIWDRAGHQAFTDLIEYQDTLFCCFRESDAHAGGKEGSIRILKSLDGKTWVSVASLDKAGVDLRDPKFSCLPDGRLMLTLGGSYFRDSHYLGCSPHVSFSVDGTSWSSPLDLRMENEWIWGVAWQGELGYGASYRLSDPADGGKPWILTLFQTANGLDYQPVTDLKVPDFPSEAVLRFLPDETMVALVRRRGNGWIGHAKLPYRNWVWADAGSRLGGPNLVVLPDGRMWAASRYFKEDDKKSGECEACTAMGPMTVTAYKPELVLLSGGDTGYPGMVYRDGVLYISYYSSHEGKSNIYLSVIAFV